jgi:hypothetical protein
MTSDLVVGAREREYLGKYVRPFATVILFGLMVLSVLSPNVLVKDIILALLF